MPLRAPTVAVLARRNPALLLHHHRRCFHAATTLRHDGVAAKNHYERLRVRHDASPTDIKKSFYALSKTHHPDANPTDRTAAHTFGLLSESYALLSDPSRRAAYDRDVLRLHHHHPHPAAPHHGGSYSSTHNPAGGRAPSGLSRRRGTFRGPPPSFYRSGGWGAHADKRRAAHDESTGSSGSSASSSSSSSPHGAHQQQNPWDAAREGQTAGDHAGMGPGSSPFHHAHDAAAPHFDREGHTRTHQREDRRRWQRARRAYGDDDVEFEPQTSLAGHFLIVAGILGATFLAPFVYLQFMRLERRKKEREY